jgi:hypothetical protein
MRDRPKDLSLTKPNQRQGRGVAQRAFGTKGLCMAVLNAITLDELLA